jgi:hypothetical protein
MAGSRPGGVTLIAVLAWISGAVNIIAGILLLIAGLMAPDALWYGLIQLALGIITIAVSFGLLRGSSTARALVTAVFVLDLISAVFVVFFQQAVIWSGIVSGILVLIGLVLLWTRPANEFFRR